MQLGLPSTHCCELRLLAQVAEALAALSDIVGAFEESYERGGWDTAQSSEAEFAPVLAAAVDPLVAACERSAEALSHDAPSRCC